MKKSLIVTTLFAGALSGMGQGLIYFNNRVAGEIVAPIFGPIPTAMALSLQGNFPSTGNPLTDAFPAGITDYLGAPRLNGTDYTAELWVESGGLWSAVLGSQRSFRTGAAAGFIQIPATGGDVSIASVGPGATATLEVRAWLSLAGTADPVDDWNEAVTRDVSRGESATFDATLGGSVGGNPALPTPNMDNFRSFNISVPEPSSALTMAVGLIATVLWRRWRTNSSRVES